MTNKRLWGNMGQPATEINILLSQIQRIDATRRRRVDKANLAIAVAGALVRPIFGAIAFREVVRIKQLVLIALDGEQYHFYVGKGGAADWARTIHEHITEKAWPA